MSLRTLFMAAAFAAIGMALSPARLYAQGDGGFDWSTAVYDPNNAGYCNASGMCAAPQGEMPPSWAQYCQSDWCAYPSWDLCYSSGQCGGIGGQGGGCDYSTDCYSTLPGIKPPPDCFISGDCLTGTPPAGTATPTPARTSTPSTTATPASTATPTPVATVYCPLNRTVAQADPAVQATKIAPNFPVVVGQDPAKTGVTLGVSVTVPPVYVSYNLLTQSSETTCKWGGFGYPGDNCENKGSEWHTVTLITQKCERRTDTYTDRLTNVAVSMNLAQSSIDWITGDLAARFPGAHVYQANWNLFPGTPGVGGFKPGSVSFAMRWDKLQTRDPGKYIVNVNGRTSGTPYTAPRSFLFSQETFSVDMLEVELTK